MIITIVLVIAIITGVVALFFNRIFAELEPADITDYRGCDGWAEAELHGCRNGLLYIPQQPISTYSSLAYLIAGLAVAVGVNTPASFVFMFTMAYLCIGSMLYHGLASRWAGHLDDSAMYATFAGLASYAMFGWFYGVVGVMLPVAVFAGYLLQYVRPGDQNRRIGILLGVTYLVVTLWNVIEFDLASVQFLIASAAAFALAYGTWLLGRMRHALDGPWWSHLLIFKRWGHGFWHVFTATAIALLFLAV